MQEHLTSVSTGYYIQRRDPNPYRQWTQRKMERSLLGITLKDRVRNRENHRRAGADYIIEHITKQKLRWAGHIINRQDSSDMS